MALPASSGAAPGRPRRARELCFLACQRCLAGCAHRRVSQNPCKDVHRPETSTARDRVLTDAEIVKFWRATEAERTEFSALLKLLLLTGCRLNEVAGMTRAELSDDRATWNIPGARTKNKRPHVVPLGASGAEDGRHRTRGIYLHDHWSIADQWLVQSKTTSRRSDEYFIMAAARPASHGRDRHGGNRDRPTHCRSGTQPCFGREEQASTYSRRLVSCYFALHAMSRARSSRRDAVAPRPPPPAQLAKKQQKPAGQALGYYLPHRRQWIKSGPKLRASTRPRDPTRDVASPIEPTRRRSSAATAASTRRRQFYQKEFRKKFAGAAVQPFGQDLLRRSAPPRARENSRKRGGGVLIDCLERSRLGRSCVSTHPQN